MFGLIPFRTNRNHSDMDEKGLVMNDFFNDFFNDNFFTGSALDNKSFNADIKENDKEYVVCAELPGVKKEDIDLDFQNNYLTVSAKRDEVHDENKDNYIRKERMYGKFSRQIYIPNVDREKITAKFENGELKVNLQKQNPTVDNKSRITIE